MIRCISCLLLCFIPVAVLADYSVNFLRITCIPETRFFEVEYKAVPGDAVFIGAGFDEKETKKRLDAWEKRGYFDPRDFRCECKLPDSTYVVTSTQPPASERGTCSGAPNITLSLSRNGEKWLDNIIFGSNCPGGPSVTSISIRDGQQGWDARNVELCIASSDDSLGFCDFLSEGAIATVMPLTQHELVECVETNRTSQRETKRAEVKVRPSLADFKKGVCRFPDLQLPPDTVIYAAGGHGSECKPLGFQIDQSGLMARRADAIVNEPNRPVALLLGAHDPTVWNIEWTQGTRILAVLASGNYSDAVSGLPKNTPVLLGVKKNKHARTCISFYVESPTKNDFVKNENREKINKISKEAFGRPADHIVHFDKGGKIHIGEPLPSGAKTITSPDTPPDSFHDPNAPLAGEPGLTDAVAKGLLRKATMADAEAWSEAIAQRDIEPVAGQGFPKPQKPVLYNAYVVLKPFTYPSGLYGAHLAIFIVPKGVQKPEGNPGHSTVYDFNSMSCTGPMCNR
jgi:hypothetical protein